MSTLTISMVDTDLALLNEDPIRFVFAEALEGTLASGVSLPPGKTAVIRVEVIDTPVWPPADSN